MLKTNRGFWKTFFLSIITFGFYQLYYIYRLAKEVNLTCAEDHQNVGGLAFFIFMSIITFGIYGLYWNYKVCDRMSGLVMRNGGRPRITGEGWLLWSLLGALIIVGPLVAMVKQIHLWNDANDIYNRRQARIYAR